MLTFQNKTCRRGKLPRISIKWRIFLAKTAKLPCFTFGMEFAIFALEKCILRKICKTEVPRAIFRRTIKQERIEMAEDLNQQEPTAEEKAKFEADVLKAAEEAMKMEAEANKAGASDQGAGDAQEQPAENADSPAENNAAAEQPADPAAEDPTAALKAALADANDRNLRLMAEFDNYRRRTAKEQLELIETANGKLLEKLSEVQDNFERAFASENKAQDLEAFEKGMQMIYNQFAKILTDAGLEQIDPTGAEFDPNMHEALMQQPSETVPEGHVVTVFQKGYKLKNKILKTAKVIVSSGK